jgi:hypothetical protein
LTSYAPQDRVQRVSASSDLAKAVRYALRHRPGLMVFLDDGGVEIGSNVVEPMAWLTDVLERAVSGRTKAHELHTLLPWNWRPASNIELSEAA